MNADLSLEHIYFSYKNTPVINDFSLEVQQGSFTTLLGSSGCGKTTLLRLISGFLEPQKGLIKINDQVQNGILPNKRKIGMVFQDYALFPHLTVEQNLLYGLKLNSGKSQLFSKKVREQNLEQVHETAKNLDLLPFLKRYPSELSGGQQQRVALGRVLILQPKILLMDEPLSSLDTNLRIKVREELKSIQQKLKITTIYVTHDQEEALSLSDNIVIIDEGAIIEQGSPSELYYTPKKKFTANFIGQANFVKWNNNYLIRPEWLEVSAEPNPGEQVSAGGTIETEAKVAGGVNISRDNLATITNTIFLGDNLARITNTTFLGDITRLELLYNGQKLIADTKSLPTNDYKIGDTVAIKFLHKWKIEE